ncbi:MAG: queuine tRNA-ribosyltransferase [Patescibacteria group bacterium]|nr:queuine tRNA-ribosyltransferase [Patescibacteria group bacterium]
MPFSFEIVRKSSEAPLARAGVIHTPHGDIHTPAFITVGTKATVKSLTGEEVRDYVGAEAVLANTYHLYLQPGDEIVKKHGGFAKMMGWVHGEQTVESEQQKGSPMPTFTDSGGFQVFSLGQALGHGVSKIATSEEISKREVEEKKKEGMHEKLATIDDDGVTFRSVIDGSEHRFTPEKSMQIQHNLGADIFFAFDECTSPLAPREYQKEAIDRTHAWAKRSLDEHKRLGASEATGEMQALFGVVQGGAYEDLRRESARTLGAMEFDGYGIGGSFTKEDMGAAVKWVCEELPDEKPRHLLGIGEPLDILLAVENGIDTFDCVAPTRIARNGALYTPDGKINIFNTKYADDMSPVSEDETWYTHRFTKSYLAHLFRAHEMTAATIASIHNVRFITELVKNARQAIIDGTFLEFKNTFIARYYKK